MGWALVVDLSTVTFRQVSVRIPLFWITISVAAFILSRKKNKQGRQNTQRKIWWGSCTLLGQSVLLPICSRRGWTSCPLRCFGQGLAAPAVSKLLRTEGFIPWTSDCMVVVVMGMLKWFLKTSERIQVVYSINSLVHACGWWEQLRMLKWDPPPATGWVSQLLCWEDLATSNSLFPLCCGWEGLRIWNFSSERKKKAWKNGFTQDRRREVVSSWIPSKSGVKGWNLYENFLLCSHFHLYWSEVIKVLTKQAEATF